MTAEVDIQHQQDEQGQFLYGDHEAVTPTQQVQAAADVDSQQQLNQNATILQEDHRVDTPNAEIHALDDSDNQLIFHQSKMEEFTQETVHVLTPNGFQQPNAAPLHTTV